MKLINPKSKSGIVNLFADYVLKSLDPHKQTSVIRVTDVGHFFVIDGMTSSSSVLDLGQIRVEFINQYRDLLSGAGYGDTINMMDLIQYSKPPVETDLRQRWFTLYNSERPMYHESVMFQAQNGFDWLTVDYGDEPIVGLDYEAELTTARFCRPNVFPTSEFPHGFSYSMDREMLYYAEYLANQIMNPILASKLVLLASNKKNEDDEPIIELKSDSPYRHDKIKSMVLDVFDFDFPSFRTKFLTDYDLCDDIIKPNERKPWLVHDVDSADLILF